MISTEIINERFAQILLVNLASEECGREFLEYPIEHTLIFYLKNKGISFNGYTFKIDHYPHSHDFEEADFLRSNQLDNDLGILMDLDFLIKKTSIPKFYTSEKTRSMKKRIVHIFNQTNTMSYIDFKSLIKKVLDSNRRDFLDLCYRIYINSI
ncbi:MAG: hypothetical protein ACTSRC_21720 [Candidatus Helarchaeota archaeon]